MTCPRPPIPLVKQQDLDARSEEMVWAPHVRPRLGLPRERPVHTSNRGNGTGGERLVTAEFRGVDDPENAAELLAGLGRLGETWMLRTFRWEGGVVVAQLALFREPSWPAAYSLK
jgi:hypothetical protein